MWKFPIEYIRFICQFRKFNDKFLEKMCKKMTLNTSLDLMVDLYIYYIEMDKKYVRE
jgi:hypothetical protein